MLFDDNVQLLHLPLGLGSVVADGISMPCQYSSFSLPAAVRRAPLVVADPFKASEPLRNGEHLQGAIVLIERGECSFEAKLQRASECGAAAVLLIDDQSSCKQLFTAQPDEPSKATDRAYCPLATVSAASGGRLLEAAGAMCELLPFPGATGEEDESEELLQVPLFPLERPLLPGSRRDLKLSASERQELLASCGGRDEGGLVAVCYADPQTRQVGAIATLGLPEKITKGLVTLGGGIQRQGSVVVRGTVPCRIVALLRHSSEDMFGVALVAPHALDAAAAGGNADAAAAEDAAAADTAAELAAEVRELVDRLSQLQPDPTAALAGARAALPAMLPPAELAFAACGLLGLAPLQEQAVLHVPGGSVARLRRLRDELARLIARQARTASVLAERRSSGASAAPFAAAAVEAALPSLVRIEPGGEEGDEKASGFVVRVAGGERSGTLLVVTNRHVVLDDARRPRGAPLPPRVTFSDGVAADAELLGWSDDLDVALLRVPRPRAASVPAAQLGDSDALRLGEWAVALGAPAEFDELVTLGIVSGLQRPERLPGVQLDRPVTHVATTAAFMKGISGGPLLDERGLVIGLNAFRRNDLAGMGFAIGINRVVDVLGGMVGAC